jgi:hypothetical protein
MRFYMRVSCGDQALTTRGVFPQVGRRLIKGKGPMETFLLKACNWEAALRSLHTVHLERSDSSPDLSRGIKKMRAPSLLAHALSAPQNADLGERLDIGEPTCLQTDSADIPVSPPGFLSEPAPGRSESRLARRRTRSSISLTADLKPNLVPVVRPAVSDDRNGTADESGERRGETVSFSLWAPTENGSSLDGIPRNQRNPRGEGPRHGPWSEHSMWTTVCRERRRLRRNV